MWERRNGRRNAFGIPCRLQRQEKHEPGIFFSVRRTLCPGREGGGFSGIKLFRRRTERVLMIFSIFSRFAKDAASGRICSQLPQELAALPSICWKEPWFLRGFETCGFLGAFSATLRRESAISFSVRSFYKGPEPLVPRKEFMAENTGMKFPVARLPALRRDDGCDSSRNYLTTFWGMKCISCSAMPNCQVAVCHRLAARFFQRTWTVTGLRRRGREGVHFRIFSLGSYWAGTQMDSSPLS